MGFLAWIATLGEGGGSSFNLPDSTGSGSGGGTPFDPITDFFRDHPEASIGIAIATTVVMLVVVLALTWVNSRGKFMFLDSVAHDAPVAGESMVVGIVDRWNRFAELGWSLFWFRVWLTLIGLSALVVAVALGVVIALPDIHAKSFGASATGGLITAAIVFLLFILPLAIVSALLDDFVVPTMYKNNSSVRDAWKEARQGLFADHAGELVLFYVLKFFIGIGVAIVVFVLVCATCCIAALPYVNAVVLLPVHVFFRSYSIYVMQQLGPDWQIFPPDAPGGGPPPAQHEFPSPGAPPFAGA